MAAKYQALRRYLEDQPEEEIVSLSFAEVDELVALLPPSARRHRSWWGNNARHPHAAAWMAAGRRVVELRLGETVVFSAADGSFPERTGKSRGAGSGVPVVYDGVEALDAVVRSAGYGSIVEAVAAHTVFLHPDTVRQTEGQAVFPAIRDPGRRGQITELADGRRVMLDDNTSPTLAFLWAAQRRRGRDVQYNHLWGDPHNLATYTALWNLAATPAFLAKTTDGSNHPEVLGALRYRAYELYGRYPAGEERPRPPAGSAALVWAPHPEPVTDLEALMRVRLRDAPKSRPAVAARALGWLFSGWVPDTTLATGTTSADGERPPPVPMEQTDPHADRRR